VVHQQCHQVLLEFGGRQLLPNLFVEHLRKVVSLNSLLGSLVACSSGLVRVVSCAVVCAVCAVPCRVVCVVCVPGIMWKGPGRAKWYRPYR
jgi:hypothetical protein